jgi:L-2,4-diaminobutyric acid acetyltransferase
MNITIRPTVLSDGQAITKLVKASGTLDVNSDYLYFLLADHFSKTCAIAVGDQGQALGFVTAYRLPEQLSTLFIWQIAVVEHARGHGLAKQLLRHFTKQAWFSTINQVVCTISPNNTASNELFKSFASEVGGRVRIKPFLTSTHLGISHEDEPYVMIDLPT